MLDSCRLRAEIEMRMISTRNAQTISVWSSLDHGANVARQIDYLTDRIAFRGALFLIAVFFYEQGTPSGVNARNFPRTLITLNLKLLTLVELKIIRQKNQP